MASAAQRRIKSISYAKFGYMFILPFFLVYCFFQIWPLLNTFILSFQGNQTTDGQAVGFDNYERILFGTGTNYQMVAQYQTDENGEVIIDFDNMRATSLLDSKGVQKTELRVLPQVYTYVMSNNEIAKDENGQPKTSLNTTGYIIHKDGKAYACTINSKAQADSNGNITGYYGEVTKVDEIVMEGSSMKTVAKVDASGVSKEFWKSLGQTFILWFGNFIPQIALSLLLAVWFTDAKVKLPGKGFFKVVMYMPNIITAASVAALYASLFGDNKYSFVNGLIMSAGGDYIDWLGSAIYGRAMVMFIQTWLWFGNTMIMLMSGIMGINPSLFEAADIDGANSMQVFFHVTMPLLQPIMVYTLVTSMIGGLQMFDIPYLYHTGTQFEYNLETVAVFIYSKFNPIGGSAPSYGYAGAASIVIFIITAALGSITFYMNRDKDEIAQKKQRKRAEKQYKAKMKRGGLAL